MSESVSYHSGSIFSGIRWTGAAQLLRVVLQFAVSIVLARLLSPSAFGLLAMASAVTATAGVFQSLGMPGVIVQRDRVSNTLVDTVFLSNLALSAGISAAVMAAAPAIAAFYGDPAVRPIVQVLALCLFLYALSGVPGALLRRRMRFAAIAKVAAAAGIVQSAVALTLALMGYGVWSLVLAMLVGAATEGLSLLCAARYRPRPRFSWIELKSILAFSVNVTGTNTLNLVAREMDKVVIGRWLGAEALGFYGMSMRFTRRPIQALVRPILGPVIFPAYSRMQNDDATTAATMRRAVAGVSLLTFPVLFGFAAVAEPFVYGLLGSQWAPAIPLIHVLAPVGIVSSLLLTVGSILVARDRTGLQLVLRLIQAAVLIVGYWVGLRWWGVLGVAGAILFAQGLLVSLELYFCARQVRMSVFVLIGGCGRIALATAAMVAAVLAVQWGLVAIGWPAIAVLAVCVITGMVVYPSAVLALRIPAAADLARLLPRPLDQWAVRVLVRGGDRPA